jgi:hypothetical protein
VNNLNNYTYATFFNRNYLCIALMKRIGQMPMRFILLYTKALYHSWNNYMYLKTGPVGKYDRLCEWLMKRYNIRFR